MLCRSLKLQTVTVGLERGEQVEGSSGGSQQQPTFEQQVAVAQAEAKKQVAMSFVRAMHLKGVGLQLDPALQAGERA